MSIGWVDKSGSDIAFKVAKDYISILGVNIGINYKEATDATWADILNKINQVLRVWKLRELRPWGKVVVVNALQQ